MDSALLNKLVIQIPCYNEEETLGLTLSQLPRQLPGVREVEWFVIDDGSSDNTVNVAAQNNVDRIITMQKHQGLAKCFSAGLEASLKAGADIIVNLDADNQYCVDDIPKLIEPILSGKAEIVVGARPISQIEHFSWTKKLLQKWGSWIVRMASRTTIPDATSGFRAISRSAAMRLNVFNEHTYTLETLIQAGQKGMAVISVPIRTNPDLRPSRLVKSIPHYIAWSVVTIVRIFMTYRPLRFFAYPGAFLFLLGFSIGIRFLWFFFTIGGRGHIQSLILASLLMGMGFFLMIIGLVTDLISVNRKLLEKLNWRVRELEDSGKESSIHQRQL